MNKWEIGKGAVAIMLGCLVLTGCQPITKNDSSANADSSATASTTNKTSAAGMDSSHNQDGNSRRLVTESNIGKYMTLSVQVRAYKTYNESIVLDLYDVENKQYFQGYMSYRRTNENSDRLKLLKSVATSKEPVKISGTVDSFRGKVQFNIEKVFQDK